MFLQQISGKRPFKSRKDRKFQTCLSFRCTPKNIKWPCWSVCLFLHIHKYHRYTYVDILLIYRIGLELKWHTTSQKPHHESYWLEQTRILSPKESKPSNLQNAQMTSMTHSKKTPKSTTTTKPSQQLKKTEGWHWEAVRLPMTYCFVSWYHVFWQVSD